MQIKLTHINESLTLSKCPKSNQKLAVNNINTIVFEATNYKQ